MDVLLFLLGFLVVLYFFSTLIPTKHNYTCNELGEPHDWARGKDRRGFEKLICKKCDMVFGEDPPEMDQH